MRPVLIVEDHPLVAAATGRRLSNCGGDLSIVVCSSAAQTLAALDSEHTDWFRIFLDLDVPGAYGLSLAREIRAWLHTVKQHGDSQEDRALSSAPDNLPFKSDEAPGFYSIGAAPLYTRAQSK